LSKNLWSSVGISALALVAAVVVIMAMLQYRGPTTKTTPVPGTASASVPVRSTSTLPSTSATPTPGQASTTPTASPTGLALANSILSAPSGASVLVIGDGTGDATNEWVAVWARDHLATKATVSYSAWGPFSSQYATAIRYGTTGQTIAVWNASVRSPDMALEPARIAKAWQTSNLVLLSYGHRRAPATITAQMDAVLAAIRAKNATVPIVVMIQNPDRADTRPSSGRTPKRSRHGQARMASQRLTSTAPSWPTRHHATPWFCRTEAPRRKGRSCGPRHSPRL